MSRMGSATVTTADPPAPRRRGRPPRINRDGVVAAAKELFARFGYRGTTLAAIAEAVGVTDAALLRHFDSKAAILEAVLAADDERDKESFLRLVDAGPLQILEHLAATGWSMEEDALTTRMQIVLTAEALGEGSELHGRFVERYRFVRRTLVKALRRGIESGDIRADIDPEYEATALLSFIEGLRINWFYYEGETPLGSYVSTYAQQMIDRIAVPRRRARLRRGRAGGAGR